MTEDRSIAFEEENMYQYASICIFFQITEDLADILLLLLH